MFSMAATSRSMIATLESASISPGSSVSVHLFPLVLHRPKGYVSSEALKPRNAGFVKIRAVNSGSPGSGMEGAVSKTIAENPVVVYSKTWCGYSSRVKSLFKRLGVVPLVVELDELGAEGSKLQKALERLTGQRTVPNVFIGAKHIGGCTDTVELHEKGELQSLLLESGATKFNRQE